TLGPLADLDIAADEIAAELIPFRDERLQMVRRHDSLAPPHRDASRKLDVSDCNSQSESILGTAGFRASLTSPLNALPPSETDRDCACASGAGGRSSRPDGGLDGGLVPEPDGEARPDRPESRRSRRRSRRPG